MLRHPKSLLQGLINQHLGLGSNILKWPIQLLKFSEVFYCGRSLRALLLIGNNLSAEGGWKYLSQDIQVSRTNLSTQPSGPESLHRQGPAPHQGRPPKALISTLKSFQRTNCTFCRKKLQGHKLRGLNWPNFSSRAGIWTRFQSKALSVRQSCPAR